MKSFKSPQYLKYCFYLHLKLKQIVPKLKLLLLLLYVLLECHSGFKKNDKRSIKQTVLTPRQHDLYSSRGP
jgi:hypothetical protein